MFSVNVLNNVIIEKRVTLSHRRHSNQHHRPSRSTLSNISQQRFEQVYTIGPFNLVHLKGNSDENYRQANIQLIPFPTGLDEFVMSGKNLIVRFPAV